MAARTGEVLRFIIVDSDGEYAVERERAEAERLNQFLCRLEAVVGTLKRFPYGPFEEDEIESLFREREGHLDWLGRVADYARTNAETFQRIADPPPRRNSHAIDTYWRVALKHLANLGLEVNQSRRVINFLVASAAPFAGASVATPDAARRFLRATIPIGSCSSVAD